MKLRNPEFEIIEQQEPVRKISDNDGSYQLRLMDAAYKQIEFAGRTCYKSTDKITDESAEPFVKRMINSQHLAMLEHGTIYLKIPRDKDEICNGYVGNPYSATFFDEDYCYVTTNLRVLIENMWFDYEYICNPTNHHHRRITVKFICDNGVAREFCRHRVFSFAQESTRYCNYSKDKFGNELTFINPCWEMSDGEREFFKATLKRIEENYLAFIKCGWKPEQARAILPLCLKTELVMTGFIDDWRHFFSLRADGITGKPHPQAEELAKPLKEEFIKRKLI